MKRLILALLVSLGVLVAGCTDDDGASEAPQLEDGAEVPAEQ